MILASASRPLIPLSVAGYVEALGLSRASTVGISRLIPLSVAGYVEAQRIAKAAIDAGKLDPAVSSGLR